MNKDFKNVIKLIKRSNDNNTHSNIVDDCIREISSWKKDPEKVCKVVSLNIFTFGILYIITLIWKQIYISLACKPCNATEADYFLIIDEDGKKFVVEAQYENFLGINPNLVDIMRSTSSRKDLSESPYVGQELNNAREETLVLYFRKNKYIFLDNVNSFVSNIFQLRKFKNYEIHKKLGGFKNDDRNHFYSTENLVGMKNIYDYNYLLNKFGYNKIEMERKSFLMIFIEQIIHPFFLYQLYASIVWTLDSYQYFSIVIMSCSLIIILIVSLQKYTNYKRILNFNSSADSYVKRSFTLSPDLKNGQYSNFIVPGDILEIGNEDVIPCDCLILDGYCTVNEADLTGESSLVLKTPLVNDNRDFNYDANKKSFLFHGTKIIKCESNSESSTRRGIYAIAVSTGYNTNRGNLIQNLLFPKPTNFKFYNDIVIFFLWMSVVWLLTIGILVYVHITWKWTTAKTVRRIFDNITVIFPPSLSICMTFTSFYFHWSLSKKNISCIDERRMNAAGRTNIIVLDKTGTLTEESLEIQGFQTTKVIKNYDQNNSSENELDFENIETDTKMMNKILKKFWKKFSQEQDIFISSNYLNNPANNIIFFIEALATCHSIDKLKNEILGNTVDKKIFEKLNWIMEKLDKNYFKNCCQEVNMEGEFKGRIKRNPSLLFSNYTVYDEDTNINYFMKPKNSFKITENFIFKNQTNQNDVINNNRAISEYSNKYYLIIIKRFEFSSKYQSMSVIVKNCLNNSYRFFIKGAPEKIAQMCSPNSLPKNFDQKQLEHTKNGFRVLACATKLLPDREDYHLEEVRHKYECNLQFLGFIIFKNRLKRDTKHVLSNLKNSNCKLVMATGDNPFTSLSVARECEMIDSHGKFIYLIDLDKEYNEESERLKISALFKDESERRKDDYTNNTFISNKQKRSLIIRKKSSVRKSILEMTQINKDVNNTNLTNANITATDRRLINNHNVNQPIEMDSRNKEYEREFTKKMREIIKNEVILCVSGKAFDFMLQKYKEEISINQNFHNQISIKNNPEQFTYAKMLSIVNEKGRIFFRMSPKDKVDLVNFFKEDKSSIVAMCGDGANDCGALLSSDVGISVKQTKGNNITSHFYSSEESISCIEHILKNGRACYENSVVVFKYMILYALIQMSSSICVYTIDQNFNTPQYFFVDCLISLVSVLMASKTNPNYKLVKDNPPNSILNLQFLISVIGQSIIQVTTVCLYFSFFIMAKINIQKDKTAEELPVATSYMFVFTVFQYISVLFVFNSNSKHRKKFYGNKTYLAYTSLILFISISFISLNYVSFQSFFGSVIVKMEDDDIGLQTQGELNRVITLAWSVGNFLITYVYELLVDFIFKKLRSRRTKF